MVRLKGYGKRQKDSGASRFNSRMVRLKVKNLTFDQEHLTGFQFQNGSIKRWDAAMAHFPKWSFNSRMVRLKALIAVPVAHFRKRFNSRMVRLKVDPLMALSGVVALFQFQNGSIKSPY